MAPTDACLPARGSATPLHPAALARLASIACFLSASRNARGAPGNAPALPRLLATPSAEDEAVDRAWRSSVPLFLMRHGVRCWGAIPRLAYADPVEALLRTVVNAPVGTLYALNMDEQGARKEKRCSGNDLEVACRTFLHKRPRISRAP
jgi:hypothetical protein